MVALGLVLVVLGVLSIVAAVFVNDGTGGQILGIDMSVTTIFLFGVAAGAAIIIGYSIMKWGTKRGLAQRKERKDLDKLSKQVEKRLDSDDSSSKSSSTTKPASQTQSQGQPKQQPPPSTSRPPEAPPV